MGYGDSFNRRVNVVDEAHGARWESSFLSEEITLDTGGTTTDSVADLLPEGAIIAAVVARITQAIATATAWKVGDGTVDDRFSSTNATLTLGTTSVGLNHQSGSVASDDAGQTQVAADTVRITTTGTPSAGKIRITVFYDRFIPPSS